MVVRLEVDAWRMAIMEVYFENAAFLVPDVLSYPGAIHMRQVAVKAVVENLGDLVAVHEGRLDPAAVWRVEVADALVDSGATQPSLPRSLLATLGLT